MEHQSALGQLDKGQIDRHAVRHTRDKPQVLVPHRQQQAHQRIVNLDCALVLLPLRSLQYSTSLGSPIARSMRSVLATGSSRAIATQESHSALRQ
jgi:hypothetical protein